MTQFKLNRIVNQEIIGSCKVDQQETEKSLQLNRGKGQKHDDRGKKCIRASLSMPLKRVARSSGGSQGDAAPECD